MTEQYGTISSKEVIQMSGRKQKTERKKAKDIPEENPQVFFEDAVLAFLRSVGQAVGSVKSRPGGAQSLGLDALYVCAMEALDLACNSRSVPNYISAAAYAVVAAMQAGKAWGLPLRPAPEPEGGKPASEQPSAPQETPPDKAQRGEE